MVRIKKQNIEWQQWAPYALLTLAIAAVYASIYGNQFIADDDVLIVSNTYLRDWKHIGKIFSSSALSGYGGIGDLYRPLQLLLNLIIYQIFGLQPAAFQTLNITLQAINACLLVMLARKMEFRTWPAVLAALLWALHPITAESIAHMSGIADPLFTFFILIGLITLIPDFTQRKFFYVCPIFILALLSKESAAIFPLLVMATMYASPREQLGPRAYLRTWPLWLIAILFVFLRLTLFDFQSADENFAMGGAGGDYATHILSRIFTCLATLPFYLRALIWPFGQHFETYFPVYTGPWHWQVFLGALMVLAAVWQLIWGQAQRGLALSWGLLWFFAAMAPNTGILLPVTFIFSEHWLYLPSIGLFLGTAESLATLCEGKRREKFQGVGIAAALALACIAAGTTWQQNNIYRDAASYYSYILSFGDPLPRVHANMAEVYMKQGDLDKALAELRTANFLNDGIPEVHQNIAFILARQPGFKKHPDEAVKELNRALDLRPDYISAYQGLAYIYGQLGDKAQQKLYLDRIQEIKEKE